MILEKKLNVKPHIVQWSLMGIDFFLAKKKKFHVLLGLILLLYFWINGNKGLDPDFGWHLRMGQIILQHGIPQTDPLSYTMPSYPFVDHEWLTNVVFAMFYPVIGLPGLILFFSFLAFAAVSLQAVVNKSKWVLIPFVLSSAGFVIFLGIRPQVISWLLFSVLLVLALHDSLWQRFRWGLPLLFILWVNLHGGFALGTAAVLLIISVKSIQQKEVVLTDWIIGLLCVIAALVNPYGLRIWWEIWMQISDNSLHWSIQEWLPAFFTFNYGFILLYPLSVILIFRYWKKFTLVELTLYVVLLLFGLSSNRQVPFWLLIAIPVTAKGIHSFYQEIQKEQMTKKRFLFAYKIFFIVIAVIVMIDFLFSLQYLGVSQLALYPQEAVQYLREHPSRGNLFSDYELGGYLDSQLPEKRVFIDGRMPSWRRSVAPVGESTDALAEYKQIMIGDSSPKAAFAKYHIDTVMIKITDQDVILKGLIEKLFPIRLANKLRLENQLSKLNMKIIYRDTYVAIYRK